MKTPPFLLFATLLFWGWESDLLWEGAAAGALLELSRIVKQRWELEDVDFHRIWTLCVVVMLALAGYVFTNNDQGGISGMFQGPSGLRNATDSSSLATTSVLRWLPLIVFPFVCAQVYNLRPTVPLTAISIVLRLRRRRGEQALAGKYVDISYAYFITSIFAAGIHANQGTQSYFWGQLVLVLWALWMLRTRRHSWKAWAAGLTFVAVLGFGGLVGVNRLEGALQNFNAQWIARWLRGRTDPSQSITSIGQIGEMKLSPRIVIRLEPEKVGVVPTYLREASYRIYVPHTAIWRAGGQADDFFQVQPNPDNKTWELVPGKKAQNVVNIACYLNGRSHDGDPQGVLPLPSGVCRLENLPAESSVIALETNHTGVALVTGSGLMIYDARYGPGATFDSPPDTGTNQLDLTVLTNEAPALKRVIEEMNISAEGTSDADKRRAVAAFFLQKFKYSMWQGEDKRGTAKQTPLTRFLLTSRSGHCEYFATATVLLLRELGVPARYAVGYYVHETSGTGYVVRERDGHAWCLAWNRKTKEWEDFDTTPSDWIAIEGERASIWDDVSDFRSWLVFQLEKLRWHQAHLRQYIVWSLSPVILVLLYYIIFQRRTHKRSAATQAKGGAAVIWPGHDSAFYRLEASLAQRGLPRQPQEALSDWLERAVAEPALAPLRNLLRELLHLHYRYRFDPHGLSEMEKRSLEQNADAALLTLAQTKARNN